MSSVDTHWDGERSEEASSGGIGRREFLKGTAILGAGIASAGVLAGCSAEPAAVTGGVDAFDWDKEVDVLVVGSGGAAWGALGAKNAGAASVLIIEKAERFGGTTSLSEGVHWIPLNYVEEEAGIEDNREDVLKYLSIISLGHASKELQESYVDNGPKFLTWSRDELGFVWERNYDWINQDYYQVDGYRPRGRGCNVNPVESTKKITGETFTRPDWPSNGQTFKLIEYLCDKQGIEIMLSTTGKKLIKNSDGRVVGLYATKADGSEIKIGASKGILIGTGGFDYNDEMRAMYLRTPVFASILVPTNTGDGHRMGMEAGAALDNMAAVYGMTWVLPQVDDDKTMPLKPDFSAADSYQFRGKPGAVVVNRYGRRIGNESTIYANFQRCMEGWDSATFKPLNIPAYWICDSTYAERYVFPGGSAVGEVPDWIAKADTLVELASKLGIDPEGLQSEITEFNKNADNGVDPVWHRGEFSHDQHSVADTSRTDLKNQCLAPVKVGPFYGAHYYPASLGTAGGLKINANAQVLDLDGNAIPGLYASGCAACSPYGAGYAGGGAPVGSSSVMAWVASRHMVGA